MIIPYTFCRHCFQASRSEEILKSCIKDYSKINDKQRIKIRKKDECMKLKKCAKKNHHL